MKLLFVIDPIEKLNLKTDSTIEIMNECANACETIYYCELKDLYFKETKVVVNATLLSMYNKQYEKIKQKEHDLSYFDLILMRKEPPYDLNYHYATMLLDKAKVPVLNDPQSLRDANEKLIILNFPGIIPKTLVSKDKDQINTFIEKQEKVVIKPIDLFGGKGIEITSNKDKNKDKKIRTVSKNGKEYVLVQEFIKEVYKGDKRIFLLNGESLGGITRIPPKGDFRANMANGGVPKKLTLSKSDKKIIKAIKPYLKKKKLDLVGVDIVKDKLIEINVTCPTGLVPIKEFNKENITKKIVKHLQKKGKKKRKWLG